MAKSPFSIWFSCDLPPFIVVKSPWKTQELVRFFSHRGEDAGVYTSSRCRASADRGNHQKTVSSLRKIGSSLDLNGILWVVDVIFMGFWCFFLNVGILWDFMGFYGISIRKWCFYLFRTWSNKHDKTLNQWRFQTTNTVFWLNQQKHRYFANQKLSFEEQTWDEEFQPKSEF